MRYRYTHEDMVLQATGDDNHIPKLLSLISIIIVVYGFHSASDTPSLHSIVRVVLYSTERYHHLRPTGRDARYKRFLPNDRVFSVFFYILIILFCSIWVFYISLIFLLFCGL